MLIIDILKILDKKKKYRALQEMNSQQIPEATNLMQKMFMLMKNGMMNVFAIVVSAFSAIFRFIKFEKLSSILVEINNNPELLFKSPVNAYIYTLFALVGSLFLYKLYTRSRRVQFRSELKYIWIFFAIYGYAVVGLLLLGNMICQTTFLISLLGVPALVLSISEVFFQIRNFINKN